MPYLQSNYCVTCGSDAITFPALRCRACIDHRMNFIYREKYYCAYCGVSCPGISVQRDYHCESCYHVTENENFDVRTYNENALPFLSKAINDTSLPIHVRQSYIRQHAAIINGVMTLAETSATTV